jgi:hypothetical protein
LEACKDFSITVFGLQPELWRPWKLAHIYADKNGFSSHQIIIRGNWSGKPGLWPESPFGSSAVGQPGGNGSTHAGSGTTVARCRCFIYTSGTIHPHPQRVLQSRIRDFALRFDAEFIRRPLGE